MSISNLFNQNSYALNCASLNTNSFSANSIDITGDAVVQGDLEVTGLSTLTGGLTTPANAVVGGTLGVTGNATLEGDLALTGVLEVGGTVEFTSAVNMKDNLVIDAGAGITIGGGQLLTVFDYDTTFINLNVAGITGVANLGYTATIIQNVVCLTILTPARGNPTANKITTDPIPEKYRPSRNVSFPIQVYDAGVVEIGTIEIATTGVITVSRLGGGNFTAGGPCGFYPENGETISFCYGLSYPPP